MSQLLVVYKTAALSKELRRREIPSMLADPPKPLDHAAPQVNSAYRLAARPYARYSAAHFWSQGPAV